ncbi:MAG: hypothetical protein ACLFT0_12585, partial [Spirulinaceae cyanobacterium]
TVRQTTARLHNERMIEKTRKANHVLYYVPDDLLDDGFNLKSKAQRNLEAIADHFDDQSRSPQKPEAIAPCISPEPSDSKDIEGSDLCITSAIASEATEKQKNTDTRSLQPETPTQPESESDHRSDRGAIARSLPAIGDQIECLEFDRAIVKVAGYAETGKIVGYAETNERLEIDPVMWEPPTIRDASGEILKKGDRVFYIGSDEKLKAAATNEPLTIKGFDFKRIRATAKHWGSFATNHPSTDFVKGRKS